MGENIIHSFIHSFILFISIDVINSDLLGPSQAHTDSVRFGEITPFEALQQQQNQQTMRCQQDSQNSHQLKQQPSQLQGFEQMQYMPQTEAQLKQTTKKHLTTKRKHVSSDEEYVPDDLIISSEDEFKEIESGKQKNNIDKSRKKAKLKKVIKRKLLKQ